MSDATDDADGHAEGTADDTRDPGTAGPIAGFRAWTFASDYRLLLVLAVAIYALFTVLSMLAGFQDPDSLMSRLRVVTLFALLYAMLTLALNLQWGYAGPLNLGIAGFMAVGVYTMAILSMAPDGTVPGLGQPLPVGILGGFLAASVLGALAALPAIRLRADYLAIVTLAFGEITRLIIQSRPATEFTLPGIDRTVGTGGTDSIALPSNPIQWLLYEDPSQPGFVAVESPTPVGEALFAIGGAFGVGETTVEAWVYAAFLFAVTALFYWLLVRIGNSPFGRVLKAIREDELVASSLGKDVRAFKIKVFALGCGLMGLVSMLWFLERGRVAPASFEPELTFFIFVALIIGGSGSNTGSVVGGMIFAAVLFEGPNFLQRIVDANFDRPPQPDTFFDAFGGVDPFLGYFFSDVSISGLRFVILGIVLVYLMQHRPEGLLGHRSEVASSVDPFERPEGGGEDNQ